MQLDGAVALVTGAGHRLGRAIALALGEAGCRIAIHFHRSADEARETAALLASRGATGEPVSADLSDPARVDDLFHWIDGRFGRLDVLVNSAASFERAPFERITPASWDAVMAVNLRAPFLCMQAAAPRMREGARDRGGRPGPAGVPGAVVNLADLSALHAWKEFAHHGASKAGLLQLTCTAAKELGPHVRVNAVIPGPILPPPGEDSASEAWRRRGARLPLGRTGDPAEVGDAVVFLAVSDFITGAAISVDGGERLLTGRPDP